MWIAIVLGSLGLSAARADERAIGYVKIVSGSASANRGGQSVPLTEGAPVESGDILQTGADGALGVTLRDDTRISLGPNTRLNLARFVFAPADRQYGLVLKLLVGSLQYISGLTGRLSPESVSITTPNFTVAVRGTRLLVRAGG